MPFAVLVLLLFLNTLLLCLREGLALYPRPMMKLNSSCLNARITAIHEAQFFQKLVKASSFVWCLCVCMHLCVWMQIPSCHNVPVEVRGQLQESVIALCLFEVVSALFFIALARPSSLQPPCSLHPVSASHLATRVLRSQMCYHSWLCTGSRHGWL